MNSPDQTVDGMRERTLRSSLSNRPTCPSPYAFLAADQGTGWYDVTLGRGWKLTVTSTR